MAFSHDVMIIHDKFVSVSRIGLGWFMLLVFGTWHTLAEFAAP